MSIKTAIRELREALPSIREHLEEERAGLAELTAELRDEVEEHELRLKYIRQHAVETLRDERRWVRGLFKGYLKEHASALYYGFLADVKRGAEFALNFAYEWLWQFPLALVVWALLFVTAGVISLGCFSLSAGKEFMEDVVG
ncbi:TPA: hypothetical protein ACKQCJ_000387 [Stenotrophomonas maltophilia]|nr:hypothetical protein B7H26_04615 [Stenotrophomonas maltophilia]MBH1451097.1 hypothetical protein [Stenotrophomonas maltophilia]